MAAMVVRIGFALIVVLALMWVLGRIARRPLARRTSGPVVSVLARQQLSRGSSVAVVKVADRALVLGVTDSRITLLAETDLADVEPSGAPSRRSPITLVGNRPAARLGAPARRIPAAAVGPLAGSILSPRTWLATVDVLRDRSVRKTRAVGSRETAGGSS